MYGYSGKILHIDLKDKKNWVEEKSESFYKTYIGGVSMASRLCWENIEVGCDPLSPGNPVCIANGIFAGTPVPVGGKYGLASKSPLTGFIGDSLSGSWFTIALKRAGWDGVVVHNSSEDWVYIFIDDDRIQIRDAKKLIGKGTYETEEAIRDELGDDQVRSANHWPSWRKLGFVWQRNQRRASGWPHRAWRCLGIQKTQSHFRPRHQWRQCC